MTRYEQGLVSELEANGQEILQAVRQEGALSAETEGKLKDLLEQLHPGLRA